GTVYLCSVLLVIKHRLSTYVWLLLGYPPLAVVHSLVCFISWILVFTIPVSKMSAQTLSVILLLPPEDILLSTSSHGKYPLLFLRVCLCLMTTLVKIFDSHLRPPPSSHSCPGVFAPTLFSKAYGNLVCDACTNTTGGNSTSNGSGLFVCHNCHYDLHCLPENLSYLHSDCCICAETRHHGTVVHWSRWRSLLILIVATVLMSACADLTTEHIQPILNQPNISQVGASIWACSDSFPSLLTQPC
ncbi:hypothetical protein GOODEAATRI_004083, partial [Goodea atripinnis]